MPRAPPIGSIASVTCDAELAGRDEHERGEPRIGRVEALDDRDRERERLARAGRALGEDVAAAQRLGDDERSGSGTASRCRCSASNVADGLGDAERRRKFIGHCVLELLRVGRDPVADLVTTKGDAISLESRDCPPCAHVAADHGSRRAPAGGSVGVVEPRLRAAAAGARAGRRGGRARPSRRA